MLHPLSEGVTIWKGAMVDGRRITGDRFLKMGLESGLLPSYLHSVQQSGIENSIKRQKGRWI